jgi:hypothetical protein
MMRSELIAEYGCTGCGRMDTFTDPCRCPEPDETETECDECDGDGYVYEQVAWNQINMTPCDKCDVYAEQQREKNRFMTETEDNDEEET